MTEQQVENQRSQERLAVEKTVDVFDQDEGNHLGRLVNVTIDGMLIMGEQSLLVGDFYCLAIHLNEYNESEPETIFCDAICLWVAPTSQEDTFWSGMQVSEMDEDSRVRLQNMLDKLSG
ncbi:MAG: PilZ domain-containing protein [Cellvibrionaceae bacterium]